MSANILTLSNVNTRVITGQTYNGIILNNCSNITIQHCTIGNNKSIGIRLSACSNITITNNIISQVRSGVYANLCTGGINISGNYMLNMLGPMPQAQFIQFDNCSGAGNIINGNHLENLPGQSKPEDAISMYQSNGTAASPIMITNNLLRGGGPSKSGSGIMLGDCGGSYQTASGNILVDPGQVGIGVASGTFITVDSNKVYAGKQPFTNVGIYAWNETNTPTGNIIITNNHINWTYNRGKLNNYWDGGNSGVIDWSTNVYDATLNAAILPAMLAIVI